MSKGEQPFGMEARKASGGGKKSAKPEHKHKIVAVIGGSENTKEMWGLYETSADKKQDDVRWPSRIRNP